MVVIKNSFVSVCTSGVVAFERVTFKSVATFWFFRKFIFFFRFEAGGRSTSAPRSLHRRSEKPWAAVEWPPRESGPHSRPHSRRPPKALPCLCYFFSSTERLREKRSLPSNQIVEWVISGKARRTERQNKAAMGATRLLWLNLHLIKAKASELQILQFSWKLRISYWSFTSYNSVTSQLRATTQLPVRGHLQVTTQ